MFFIHQHHIEWLHNLKKKVGIVAHIEQKKKKKSNDAWVCGGGGRKWLFTDVCTVSRIEYSALFYLFIQ
jgi:hypothetical protein